MRKRETRIVVILKIYADQHVLVEEYSSLRIREESHIADPGLSNFNLGI